MFRTLSKSGATSACTETISGPSELASLPINEEDEGSLSPPQAAQNSIIEKIAEVVKPKILPKPRIDRPRGLLGVGNRLRILGDDRDLSQLEARALLAKKLNELASNRLDIWEKRQKFVRQKSFDLESDMECEGDATGR